MGVAVVSKGGIGFFYDLELCPSMDINHDVHRKSMDIVRDYVHRFFDGHRKTMSIVFEVFGITK